MLFLGFSLHIIKGEHRVNRAVLESSWVPAPVKLLYGQLRNRLGRQIYRSRFCPVPTSPTRIVASVLQPGDVYLDIGANEGQMVSLASVAIGSSGRIYAFEPRETAFRHLQLLCSAYGLSNVELYQFLVGDHNGERVLFESPDHPSSSSLSREWADGVARTYPMITLDRWAQLNSVQQVDLIKIDVEGAEIQVLSGGLQFLRQTLPLLIIEIRERKGRRQCYGYDVSDLIELLRSVGYTDFYCLRRTGLVKVQSEVNFLPDDEDMLAFCLKNTSHIHAVKGLTVNW